MKKKLSQLLSSKDGSMTFIDHLDELRIRLIRVLVIMLLCVLLSYAFRKEILDIIREPVDLPLKKYTSAQQVKPEENATLLGASDPYSCTCDKVPEQAISGTAEIDYKDLFSEIPGDLQTLSTTDVLGPGEITSFYHFQNELNLHCLCTSGGAPAVTESQHSSMVFIGLPELFFAQMKVAVFAGFFFSFPFLFIELWGFFGPALYRKEKKIFWIFSVSSYIFFVGGALFGYFIVFPYGFDFFLSLTQVGEIMPSLSVGHYLSFAMKLLFIFGLIFELPLATFILARIGILTPRQMIRQFRLAILVIFVASAVLTPPDPFTMVLMAGPLVLLYIISIGICFVGKKQ